MIGILEKASFESLAFEAPEIGTTGASVQLNLIDNLRENWLKKPVKEPVTRARELSELVTMMVIPFEMAREVASHGVHISIAIHLSIPFCNMGHESFLHSFLLTNQQKKPADQQPTGSQLVADGGWLKSSRKHLKFETLKVRNR